MSKNGDPNPKSQNHSQRKKHKRLQYVNPCKGKWFQPLSNSDVYEFVFFDFQFSFGFLGVWGYFFPSL